jgi:LacI family transcriptional regulator
MKHMTARKNITAEGQNRAVKEPVVTKRRSLIDFPYRNLNARSQIAHHLHTGKNGTNTIGVIVHELQSDFIKSALEGVETTASQHGYELVITHSEESIKKEVANAQLLLRQRVDGLIASLSFETTNVDHFRDYRDKRVPIVFFDRVDTTVASEAVVIDNAGTGYAATRHLVQQGCRRIAIVTSTMERNVYADRFRGFLRALRDHQIDFSDKLLIVNDISEEAGVQAAKKLLAMKNRPDGLFVTNDLVAAVCMRMLMASGVEVPRDMAIVGFNNDSICKLTIPTITTINYPGFEMGRVAAMKLINVLRGKQAGSEMGTAIVPAELIVRHSSLKNTHALHGMGYA